MHKRRFPLTRGSSVVHISCGTLDGVTRTWSTPAPLVAVPAAPLGVGQGAFHEPRLIAVKLPGWDAEEQAG